MTKKRSDSLRELAASTDAPADLAPLEVLPGVLVECLADEDRKGSELLEGVEWPSLFACPPAVGDFVYSVNQEVLAEVFRRGHKIGPFGPYVVVFLASPK